MNNTEIAKSVIEEMHWWQRQREQWRTVRASSYHGKG